MKVLFKLALGVGTVAATTSSVQPTVGQLTARGCYQTTSYNYGVHWQCLDGSKWIVDSHTQQNAFPFFSNTDSSNNFPVVATHGSGAGEVCGFLPDCSSCASTNGCVWATGKCISDTSCRGDPYCTENAAQCSEAFDYTNTVFGATPSYTVVNGVEVAFTASGGFSWPSTTPTATGSYQWRPLSQPAASTTSYIRGTSVQPTIIQPSTVQQPVVQSQPQQPQQPASVASWLQPSASPPPPPAVPQSTFNSFAQPIPQSTFNTPLVPQATFNSYAPNQLPFGGSGTANGGLSLLSGTSYQYSQFGTI